MHIETDTKRSDIDTVLRWNALYRRFRVDDGGIVFLSELNSRYLAPGETAIDAVFQAETSLMNFVANNQQVNVVSMLHSLQEASRLGLVEERNALAYQHIRLPRFSEGHPLNAPSNQVVMLSGFVGHAAWRVWAAGLQHLLSEPLTMVFVDRLSRPATGSRA